MAGEVCVVCKGWVAAGDWPGDAVEDVEVAPVGDVAGVAVCALATMAQTTTPKVPSLFLCFIV